MRLLIDGRVKYQDMRSVSRMGSDDELFCQFVGVNKHAKMHIEGKVHS